MDVPAGVTQEEGHTGFLIHLPSADFLLMYVTDIYTYMHTSQSTTIIATVRRFFFALA